MYKELLDQVFFNIKESESTLKTCTKAIADDNLYNTKIAKMINELAKQQEKFKNIIK